MYAARRHSEPVNDMRPHRGAHGRERRREGRGAHREHDRRDLHRRVRDHRVRPPHLPLRDAPRACRAEPRPGGDRPRHGRHAPPDVRGQGRPAVRLRAH